MVTITVTDPRIEQAETRSSFTSYLVSTKQGNSVRRRYSDFRWLYERLRTEVPGAIVPIIPHTRTIMSGKKFNLEFIEERRRDLQEFLLEIAYHSELCRAPSMTPFMLLELGEDFDEGKLKVEAQIPTIFADKDSQSESGSQTKTKLVSAKKGMTNFFAKVKLSATSQELLTSQDESQIVALNSYVAEVYGNMKPLTKASETLLKSTSSTADAYNEIGVPVGLWRTTFMQQATDQDDSVAEMMAGITKFSDDMSSSFQKKHKEEEFLFGHAVQKLTNTLAAFEVALEQRQKIQVEYTRVHNNLIEKNCAIEKAQRDTKPPEVTDKLASEKMELESKLEQKKKRFEEVTQRVIRDGEKCKPKLTEMLKSSFVMLAKAEISYTTHINEICQRLVKTLENGEGTPLPSAPPGPPPPSAPPEIPFDDMG